MAEVEFKVEGMTCGGCVKNVTAVLQKLPGVSAAEVSLAEAKAKVSHDPAQISVDALRAAVEDAGFDCPQ
ncbi:MAG: heavy-metal-associated domain-containing protein [Thauera sp.]|nr:heavy-metal-associated domain-containing protein [Thauera sp.]